MRSLTLLFLSTLLLVRAADNDFAGRYTGVWTSGSSGNTGAINMTLTPVTEGAWKCDISFTLAGDEVKCKVQSFKLEHEQFDVAYDFQVQGVTARSKLNGKWDGKAFAGSYQTTVVDSGDGVDAGTWNAVRAK